MNLPNDEWYCVNILGWSKSNTGWGGWSDPATKDIVTLNTPCFTTNFVDAMRLLDYISTAYGVRWGLSFALGKYECRIYPPADSGEGAFRVFLDSMARIPVGCADWPHEAICEAVRQWHHATYAARRSEACVSA